MLTRIQKKRIAKSAFIMGFIVLVCLTLSLNNFQALASEGQKSFQRKALSPILKKHHLSFPDCGLVDNNTAQTGLRFFTYPLDDSTQLYGILCDSSAYNTSFALYLVRDNNYHNTERLYFPSFTRQLGWGGRNTLYNASYNPDTGFLTSKTKYHAQRDCGSKALYQWTGKGFRLLRYRSKQKCSRRASGKKWPLIYRYKARRGYTHIRSSGKTRNLQKRRLRRRKQRKRIARYKRRQRLKCARYSRSRYQKRRARRIRARKHRRRMLKRKRRYQRRKKRRRG